MDIVPMDLRYRKSGAFFHGVHGVWFRKGHEKYGAAGTVTKVSMSDIDMMILLVIGSRLLGFSDDVQDFNLCKIVQQLFNDSRFYDRIQHCPTTVQSDSYNPKKWHRVLTKTNGLPRLFRLMQLIHVSIPLRHSGFYAAKQRFNPLHFARRQGNVRFLTKHHWLFYLSPGVIFSTYINHSLTRSHLIPNQSKIRYSTNLFIWDSKEGGWHSETASSHERDEGGEREPSIPSKLAIARPHNPESSRKV